MPGLQDREAQLSRLLEDIQQRATIQQAMSIDNSLDLEGEKIYNITWAEKNIT